MSITAERSREARSVASGASLAFAGVFAPLAVLLAYLPVWFEHVGFTPAEIGLLLGVPLAVRMAATPLFVALGDRAADRSRTFVGWAALTFAVSLAYLGLEGFAAVMAVTVAVSVGSSVVIPLADAIALSGVRRHGLDYGRMRAWGSAAFVAVTLGAGWTIDRAGVGVVPFVLALTFALTVASGLFLPPVRSLPSQARTAAPPWRDRTLVIACVAGGLAMAGHAAFYGFSSIHWLSLGFSGAAVGLLWSIGVLSEIALFALAPRVLPRAMPFGLLIAGSAIGVVRWWTFTIEGGVAWYALNSVLHGATFGACHLGLQRLIAARVADARQGSAQALSHLVSAPVMAGATLASGWLYGRLSVDAFLAMSGLCLAGLILAVIAARQPQSVGEGGETSDPE